MCPIKVLSPGVCPTDEKAARITAMLQGTKPMDSKRWPIPRAQHPGRSSGKDMPCFGRYPVDRSDGIPNSPL